jgi:DNA replication and repair protein RecF
MPLNSLSIDRFRNLEPAELQFSPQVNIFFGDNAAGKTSVLESLYVLARARSFRTRDLDNLIQKGASGFQLVARISQSSGHEIPVGLCRSEKRIFARIDGKPINRLSDLASLFPVHWLGGNLHQLIEEGPAFRRQYLDWGLFHVKPGYPSIWKRFQKLLRQRNAALRTSLPPNEVSAWNPELSIAGEELHAFRKDYVKSLNPLLNGTCRELLELTKEVRIRYRKGWPSELALSQALEAGLDNDRDNGYTRAGPHRAELVFLCDDRPVNEQFSRGQQKLLIIALQAAQAQLLRQEIQQTSFFLLDDLGAELDTVNQGLVMNLLSSIEAQVFVTAINDPLGSDWMDKQIKRFHVKHGSLSEML